MAACILARDTNRYLPTVRSCVSVSEVETRRDLAVRHEVLEEDRLLCAIGHSGDATSINSTAGMSVVRPSLTLKLVLRPTVPILHLSQLSATLD